MLIHDKYGGWLTTCDECIPRNIWGGVCPFCDGSRGNWDATIDDFDGETVRLTDGKNVTVDDGLFWSMDGDPLRKADIADIVAVLEAV